MKQKETEIFYISCSSLCYAFSRRVSPLTFLQSSDRAICIHSNHAGKEECLSEYFLGLRELASIPTRIKGSSYASQDNHECVMYCQLHTILPSSAMQESGMYMYVIQNLLFLAVVFTLQNKVHVSAHTKTSLRYHTRT